MAFKTEIHTAASNPHQLELLYKKAQQDGQADVFQSELLACYETTPDNLLYAAWFYRFQHMTEDQVKQSKQVNWILAVPLSIMTGLIFWVLSDFEHLLVLGKVPQFLLWWSPIATMSALIFLAFTSRTHIKRALALGTGLLAVSAYALLMSPGLDPTWKASQYIGLAAIHIPLLCWVFLGISILGFNSTSEDRFAFLIKSIEVMVTAGLYLIAGLAFGGITVGMFAALNIKLPDIWMRLIVAGGFGLLPVLAVATIYNPSIPPSQQNFEQGLSKFIATMMRLLLPLTLGVLVTYSFVIPFNFIAPYQNRDVLIVYNLMLFAILGLLLGATPIQNNDLPIPLQKWLRSGIIAVAILVTIISLYALSATVFRTLAGGLTLNRLTIIGWNTINIGILVGLIYTQFKHGRQKWIASLQSVFSLATNAYMVWGLFLLLAVPLLF
ncbi:MAG: hypothetical protein P1S60_06875 [Anaerolineae bacterium]|nr:hypothetical protein [Anaerolineae bacterium]